MDLWHHKIFRKIDCTHQLADDFQLLIRDADGRIEAIDRGRLGIVWMSLVGGCLFAGSLCVIALGLAFINLDQLIRDSIFWFAATSLLFGWAILLLWFVSLRRTRTLVYQTGRCRIVSKTLGRRRVEVEDGPAILWIRPVRVIGLTGTSERIGFGCSCGRVIFLLALSKTIEEAREIAGRSFHGEIVPEKERWLVLRWSWA